MTDLVPIPGYEPSAARAGDRFTLVHEYVVTPVPKPAWLDMLYASAPDPAGRLNPDAVPLAFGFYALREAHTTFHLAAHPDRVVGLGRNVWCSDWQTSAADLPGHTTEATITLTRGGRVRAGWLHPDFSTRTLAGGELSHGLFVLVDNQAYGSARGNARTLPGIAAGLQGAARLDGGLTPAGRQLADRADLAELGPLWCELVHTALNLNDSEQRHIAASVLAELAPTWTDTLAQLRTVLTGLGLNEPGGAAGRCPA